MKVTEDNKTNALITAPGVNVERFWPGLFAMSLANLSIGTLTYNLGAGGPVQQEVLPLPALWPPRGGEESGNKERRI